MIEPYIKEKVSLYSRFSRFACDGACPRYGCMTDLAVSVSIIELYSQARFLGRPAADVFSLACRLSPYPDGGIDRVRIRIALKKPCVFLDGRKLCSMHPARPAACALFPEFLGLVSERDRQEHIDHNGLNGYPCVRPEVLALSPERMEAVRDLRRLHEREMYATELYLFGLAGFSVDLREDLLAVCPNPARDTADGGALAFTGTEEALDRHLRRTGLEREIMSKITGLEGEDRAEGFLPFLEVAEQITAPA